MFYAVWLNANENKISRIEDITYSKNNDKSYIQKELNCDYVMEATNILNVISDVSYDHQLDFDVSFLLGLTDIVEEFGWSKQKITTYRNRGKFPEPIGLIGKRPVWSRAQIKDYMNKNTS
ncbi:helix-turn-helix transcriptional regulator [Shimazuella kribbensis]|uniref:helix-turn-helix transcriptional regulator n=1 Tax=Shimazuella kribbensis TaxID=139808 RepID=UPI00041AE889|nr:hypothetical protein [Shimazuella kribbensis]